MSSEISAAKKLRFQIQANKLLVKPMNYSKLSETMRSFEIYRGALWGTSSREGDRLLAFFDRQPLEGWIAKQKLVEKMQISQKHFDLEFFSEEQAVKLEALNIVGQARFSKDLSEDLKITIVENNYCDDKNFWKVEWINGVKEEEFLLRIKSMGGIYCDESIERILDIKLPMYRDPAARFISPGGTIYQEKFNITEQMSMLDALKTFGIDSIEESMEKSYAQIY